MKHDDIDSIYSSSITYNRKPVNKEVRTILNDVYLNIQNENRTSPKGEYEFRQDHIMKYYIGSSPDLEQRNREELPQYDHYDVSVISQTTLSHHWVLTNRPERLFFFKHLLSRWRGFAFLSLLTLRPISITIMVRRNESDAVEQFIRSSGFPSRLRLALYIFGISDRPDCVNKFDGKQMVCVEEKIYPLNLLRNIAIKNTVTSHFVVFDMDMWPSSFLHASILISRVRLLHDYGLAWILYEESVQRDDYSCFLPFHDGS